MAQFGAGYDDSPVNRGVAEALSCQDLLATAPPRRRAAKLATVAKTSGRRLRRRARVRLARPGVPRIDPPLAR